MAYVPQPSDVADDNKIRHLGGRDFCDFGLENKISCVPVDVVEDNLFNDFHWMLRDDDVLPTILIPPELGCESPVALDCGYGTGKWMEDLLEEADYDSAVNDPTVTGIDIFDRPKDGLQEFGTIKWNLNAPFGSPSIRDKVRTDSLDLINSRFLTDGINSSRWDPLIREYLGLLKYGGWLQMVEVQWTFCSKSNQALPNLTVWSDAYSEALRRMQKNPDITGDLERLVRFAGFERVQKRLHHISVGEWRSEDEDDDGRARIMRYVHSILESFAIIPFTQHLGWTSSRTMQVVQAAQAELRIPNASVTFDLTAVYGRRPRPRR